MITLSEGNLLKSDAEALVNTVNTVGVMGKGIALQFKKAFPENFEEYARACEAGEVRPGLMFVTRVRSLGPTKYIINFPTKRHWKGKSRMEDIKLGLADLVETVRRLRIQSIAIPPLGCGLGGLLWADVHTLIRDAFADLPDVDVRLYPPKGTPDAHSMPNRTKRPGMTPGRASLLGVLARYADMRFDPEVTLIETQKLSYFLQLAGEPLRLKFVKWCYGPYADNLRHVISEMDGHYLSGWGAGENRPMVKLRLMQAASSEIDAKLRQDESLTSRIERVLDLIEGFDSPYGLELLASVHWVITRELNCKADPSEVFNSIGRWTDRKSRMFKQPHIDTAVQRLQSQGWLEDCPLH